MEVGDNDSVDARLEGACRALHLQDDGGEARGTHRNGGTPLPPTASFRPLSLTTITVFGPKALVTPSRTLAVTNAFIEQCWTPASWRRGT
jgi:hypothetical protein